MKDTITLLLTILYILSIVVIGLNPLFLLIDITTWVCVTVGAMISYCATFYSIKQIQ